MPATSATRRTQRSRAMSLQIPDSGFDFRRTSSRNGCDKECNQNRRPKTADITPSSKIPNGGAGGGENPLLDEVNDQETLDGNNDVLGECLGLSSAKLVGAKRDRLLENGRLMMGRMNGGVVGSRNFRSTASNLDETKRSWRKLSVGKIT